MASEMNRRTFIKATVVGFTGLTIGCPDNSDDVEPIDGGADTNGDAGVPESYSLDLWINIDASGKITVQIVKAEMGQGISTGIAMIVAEELDAAWKDMYFELVGEFAENAYAPYGFGSPMTSASTSISVNYTRLREIGAAAREMLVAAAAARWGVEPATLTTAESTVLHPSHGSLTYGELAEDASNLPVPQEPTLKDPARFKLIGTPAHRLDTTDMVNGKSVFGQDVVLPGMVYGAVRHCSVLGAHVTNLAALQAAIADTAAMAVVQIPHGIVVVAPSIWQAQKVADSLVLETDATPTQLALSSDSISSTLAECLTKPGLNVHTAGDAPAAMAAAETTVEAVYEVPLLAHETMEPMVCTARVDGDQIELWLPTQGAAVVVRDVAAQLQIPEASITVHATHLGGGFGRKVKADYAVQAVLAARETGEPVKVMWARKEDVQHDFYRPAFTAELKGGLDAQGNLVAWMTKNAGPSILGDGLPFPVDPLSIAGFNQVLYEIPNQQIDHVACKLGVPVGFWRSIGHSQNAFFVEGFIDELAVASGQDPLAFRKKLVHNDPRHLAVLERVEAMSNWGTPSVPGAAQGVSFTEGSGTYTAQVAEVSVDPGNKMTVHKVYAAVDCGRVINPDAVEAQIQGGVVFGLSAALTGEITIQNGQVQQSNFHDCPILTLADTPPVEVGIVDSTEPPGGVGELGVSPVAPAVVNAIHAATGTRIRRLPISRHFGT